MQSIFEDNDVHDQPQHMRMSSIELQRTARRHIKYIIDAWLDKMVTVSSDPRRHLVMTCVVPPTSPYDDWTNAHWLTGAPATTRSTGYTRHLLAFIEHMPLTTFGLIVLVCSQDDQRTLGMDYPPLVVDLTDIFCVPDFDSSPATIMTDLWDKATEHTTALWDKLGLIPGGAPPPSWYRVASGANHKQEIVRLAAADHFFDADITSILADPRIDRYARTSPLWQTMVLTSSDSEEVLAFTIFSVAEEIHQSRTVAAVELKYVFVAPDHRGKYYGTLILHRVLDQVENWSPEYRVLVRVQAKADEKVFKFWFTRQKFESEGHGRGHRLFSTSPLLHALAVDDEQSADEVKEAKQCLEDYT